jgi:enoyl-CoA hydratase/carnithine racemase
MRLNANMVSKQAVPSLTAGDGRASFFVVREGNRPMSANPVLWNLDERGVATVTLNRPEVNNAYDAGLIGGVLAAMDDLGKKPSLRVVVLKGNGRHFQAGADLKWINGVRPKSSDENEAVSRATFEAVQRLNLLPIPTVALVQGGCFGGGTGVISACDVVIAADNAMFSITEGALGVDGRDHHPAIMRRHRRPAGSPLRADRRTF